MQFRSFMARVGRCVLWFLILGAGFLVTLPWTSDWLVGWTTADVAEPLDGEMPVTVASYPSSKVVVGILGGRGEGLNCSLPPGMDYLFRHFGEHNRTPNVRQHFRQACVFHDLCYRHGLATYGYTQVDCDEALQEQALRICVVASRTEDRHRCQIYAKKVALGVKNFGFKFFHGWGKSTYFEFDPLPNRSQRFFAARVVSKPFDGEQAKNQPDDWIMSFDITRGGVHVRCRNCRNETFRQMLGNNAPDSIASLSVRAQRPVWLPPGSMISTPSLFSDLPNREFLIWYNRWRQENTDTCIVAATPERLLLGTFPRVEGCQDIAKQTRNIKLRHRDIYSSSPQTLLIPNGANEPPLVAAVGLTVQLVGSVLSLCAAKDLSLSEDELELDRRCKPLHDTGGKPLRADERFSAFQMTSIARGATLVLFLRNPFPTPPKYGRVVTFRIDAQDFWKLSANVSLKAVAEADIMVDDSLDPAVPVMRDDASDQMLALRSQAKWYDWIIEWLGGHTSSFTELREFATTRHGMPVRVSVTAGKETDKNLPSSWFERPALITQRGDGAVSKTEILLSRSALDLRDDDPGPVRSDPVDKSSAPSVLEDRIKVEFARLERPAPNSFAAPFVVTGAWACSVRYEIIEPDRDRINPCLRSVRNAGYRRATPATRLHAGQVVTGKFEPGGGNQIAILDACFGEEPVYLDLDGKGSYPRKFPADDGEAKKRRTQRTVDCRPVDAEQVLTQLHK